MQLSEQLDNKTKTKLDTLDSISFPGFHLLNKNRKHKKRASGGIAVLISDELVNYVRELDVEQVDSIWLKINDINNGNDLIICFVYIPPANSPYARIAIFDEIEDTIIDFRARYVNADFCIMGDLNARTGIADDFLVNSKYVNCQPDDELEMLTLSLNIQEKRVSVDKVVNTYGNRLLELCKSANMYMVNGQFDNDALQRKATCDNVSVVDYVICSPSIFSYIDITTQCCLIYIVRSMNF